MRESQFIHRHKEKWHEFEKILHTKRYDPEKLSNLFVEITEDLSYARTFYPYRSVRYYLNSLALKIFHRIYRHRSYSFRNFVRFWSDELPMVMYGARKLLLISTLIFLFTMLLGVFAAASDNNFISLMLGDHYINMTQENIDKGDPMAVYKGDADEMFLMITWNNIKVSFSVFVFGLLAGIGSLYILMYNAMMLGAFQFMFYEHNVLGTALVTVWQHGTLEISSIIIAGAAGLTLGRGLIFPGTYTRLEAFRLSANRGLKILMGTIPLFVIAGFIESFITRQTGAPLFLRLIVIALSLTFILLYFVWLPWFKHKRGLFNKYPPAAVPPSRPFALGNDMLNNAGIIRESFFFVRENIRRFASFGALMALFIALILLSYYMAEWTPINNLFTLEDPFFGTFHYIHDLFSVFDLSSRPLILVPLVVWIAWLMHSTLQRLSGNLSDPIPFEPTHFLKLMLMIALPLAPALISVWLALILWLLFAPFWFGWILNNYRNTALFSELPAPASISSRFYFRFQALILTSLLILMIMITVFASPAMELYRRFILDHLAASSLSDTIPYTFYLLFTGLISLSLMIPFLLAGMVMLCRSAGELVTARSLLMFFENMPLERREYGVGR
jgi:uncharacterized membrane protein SpoIIM required for sporulation